MSGPGGRRSRLFGRDWGWELTLATGAGLVGCLGLHLFKLGDEASRKWITDFAYIPVSVLAAVLCVRAARHPTLDGRIRRAWMVMAAAGGCMIVANVVWWWMDAVRRIVPPFPSVADAGFLLFMPVVFVALSTFPARPRTRHERFKLLLDIAVVVVGGFMVQWYLILGPTIAAGGVSALGVATSIAYPVGDLVLLSGLAAVLMRGPAATSRRPLQILAASLGLHIVADVYVGYIGLHQGFVGGTWPDLFYLTSLYLFAVAAAEQYRQANATDDATATGRRHAINRLPYVVVAVSYALLMLIAHRQPIYPLGGLLAGAVTLTGLVVTRQVVALRDNETLVVTDALTGLANRTRLRSALDRALARTDATDGAVGVLMLDLDGFKAVNDAFGHETGDGLLTAFAGVLRRCVRAGDTAGRLGGDEFAIVLPEVKGAAAAVLVAERILAALREPVQIGEHTVTMRTSIGIALAEDPETPAAEVQHQADMAMYAAKRRGLHGYVVHGQDPDSPEQTRQQLHVDLMQALERDEFFLVYQPIVDMDTEQIHGVEALIRWRHPQRGVVPPMEFIPACEEIGLIDQIGIWVLATACRQVAQWQRELGPPRRLQLHVNLSPRQMDDPDIVTTVVEVLHRAGFDPCGLVLELTENVLLDDAAGVVDKLTAFKDAGVRLAIDDFGTGFSSLSYLTRLPVDILKIDRRFIAELGHDTPNATITEAIIRLAEALHLDTVAEGIEEHSQATDLIRRGCTVGQGYYFARPQDAGSITTLLNTRPDLHLRATATA